MVIMQDAINQWKENKTIENREEEEESKFARRMEEEKKIEKMHQELGISIRVPGDQPNEEKVKLLKLVNSPFLGTYTDFFRFWNQFETQIDKIGLHCVTKLSYLNEMIVPKVRLPIKGLPLQK